MLQKGTLKALDKNVIDVCTVIEDSESSFADISEVIMRDAALSTNLLTTANSALFAGVEPVKTISAAVLRIGFQRIRALAVGLALFKQTGHNARTPDLYRMYAASYFAGTLARELCRRAEHPVPEEAFVSGLLFQVPRLLLANTFPEQYRDLERMMVQEEVPFEEACRRVFGVEYGVIRRAVLQHWKLLDDLNRRSRSREDEHTANLRETLASEASHLADMLFGNTTGGEAQLRESEERIAAALRLESFSAEELIRAASERDANIQRFFNLSTRDVEMMVKIVQWGRVSAAQIAAGLTLGSAQHELDERGDVPEIAIGNYLTELTLLARRVTDFNHLLLLAQEAIFRCIHPDDAILALVDSGQTILRGRFHAGTGEKTSPSVLTVELNRRDSPIVQCLLGRAAWRGEAAGPRWNIPIIDTLQAKHLMLAPILTHERALGLHFLARRRDPAFSKQEQSWLEAIGANLGFAFENRR